MLKRYLEDTLNAIMLQATNALAKGVNPRIQRIKKMSCGFQNREHFRQAILFHLGGLDLYPASVKRS
jgi:transposase